MRFRIFVFLALFVGLAGLALSQSFSAVGIVQAAVSPATKPVTYFTYLIRGKLTYRFLNILPMPARGVTVTAKNLSNNQTFSTKTNINGVYIIEIKEASPTPFLVKPEAVGSEKISWTPKEYRLFMARDLSRIDFAGTNIIPKAPIIRK